MNFIHHQGVLRRDEPVLEPAPRYPGRDNDDVPRRRLRRCFPLAVDYADLERRAENRLRHIANRQGLAGARAGDDSESLPGPRQPANVVAVLSLGEGFELQAKRQLDGLTRRACRRDDDDPSSLWFGSEEYLGVWGEEVIARDPLVSEADAEISGGRDGVAVERHPPSPPPSLPPHNSPHPPRFD